MVAAQRRRRPTQSLPAVAAVAAALAAAAGVPPPEAAPCTIARVPVAELSAEEFLTLHRHRHPLLLSGMTDGWRARARWSWEFLTSAASNASGAVNVGTGASLAASGMASARPTLSRFVQQHVKGDPEEGEEPGNPPYIFDGSFFVGREDLQADYRVPLEYFPFQATQENITFYGGNAGTGLGFHKHGETINALVRGRKRWLIYRPESLSLAMGMDASLSGAQWLQHVYPTLPAEARPEHECVQEAGEILYIPAFYHHATVNLEDSLGLATRQATGGRLHSDAAAANSLADSISAVTLQTTRACGGDGNSNSGGGGGNTGTGGAECAAAQTALAALLVGAGRAKEAMPLIQHAIAVTPPPRNALLLHGELLMRKGTWNAPVAGAASVLRAYDAAVAATAEAEAAAEAAGPTDTSEAGGAMAVRGKRHIFTGPSKKKVLLASLVAAGRTHATRTMHVVVA
jgi:hypothetical protein